MKHSKITQRGDSLSFNMDTPSNFHFDNDRFNSVCKFDNNGLVIYETKELKDQHRKEHFGISKLNIIGDKIEIGISGKILGDNYKEGITLNTLPDIVRTLNDISGMNITTDGVLRNSFMRTFDNTYNIELDEKDCVGEYIDSLSFGSIGNSKLGAQGYTDESLILQLDTKVKNRLLFYNKELELRTHSKDFNKVYNLSHNFQDTLRVELNIIGMDKMRQNFKLSNDKVRLLDIFSSKENAVWKNFSRFVNTKISEKWLFDYDTLTTMEYKHKSHLHEKFFLEEKFKLYKGNLDRIYKIYEKLYKDGIVPSKEKVKIRTYFKDWENSSKNMSGIVRDNKTRKFKELVNKIQSLQ